MISQEKYASSKGSICPNYGGGNLDGWSRPTTKKEIPNKIFWNRFYRDCGGRWYEIYSLTGYEDFEKKEAA